MRNLAVGVALVASVLLVRASSNAQARTPETVYYADAYADHFEVPRALVRAIITQESNWNPRALSVKGAAGLMQLMPSTAAAYRVRNRYSVTENLSGGVEYLADLLGQFRGEMRLAVAAYYCGSRNIQRKGLSYRNPEVVAYVESVRRRYQRELQMQAGRGYSLPAGGQ
jgi:soluble lytic murein transglycosylase-like protein